MSYQPRNFKPLPPYRDPRDALAKALPSLQPPKRVSVVDAAEAHMRVKVNEQWSRFNRDTVPYMNEPMEMATSRDYRAMVFAGPSRTGKTMLLNAVWAHSIMCDPGRVAIYFDERTTRDSFELDTFSAIVRNSPDIAAMRGSGRGSDTIESKLFRGGSHVTLDIATASRMQERTLRVALATEFDRWGSSIDGEGEPYILLSARTHMAGSRGMVIMESSPRAPIKDENSVSADPHVPPLVDYGVFLQYRTSTRARYYWNCIECGAGFVPNYNLLDYPDSRDPVECGAMARLRCPHCNERIGHEHKDDMNRAGQWRHMGKDGKTVLITDPDIIKTIMLGYWLDGLQAGFMTWADIVQATVKAEAQFAATGDEESLRATINTRHGMAYLPRAGAGGDISLDDLRQKASRAPGPRGTAPDWTRFITLSIDVQSTYFSVGVYAWGLDGRRKPIDRFDLNVAPKAQEDAADRVLKPGLYAGDWSVLTDLETRRWPIEGGDWELGAVAAVVDMQGEKATTPNAYAFKRERRKAGFGQFWYLSRGREKRDYPDRVWLATPEKASGKSNRRAARDIQILNMATDRLKGAVAASLTMAEDGANYCHIPGWMTQEELTEFTAERSDDQGRWSKRPGFVRNESLDHAVQALALFIVLGGERLRPDAMPDWARLDLANPHARFVGAPDKAPVTAPPRAAPAPWIPKRDNWL
ncbi:terminase gpA endonuclease subunit [Shimia ponticola]|uniref:terminase gpA endonuclease subunit n=1 Tax=Shimia ponticola TaxID=2582893 RepID=UPI0011BD69D5|nr:terminase gpA endonuclease subunit [Shimia ponticola]